LFPVGIIDREILLISGLLSILSEGTHWGTRPFLKDLDWRLVRGCLDHMISVGYISGTSGGFGEMPIAETGESGVLYL
jgi:hypothetical protein